jgi:hypothetical protein
LNILVACEFSGIVRSAFEKYGHNVWSCDLLDTEIPGNHIIGNVLDYLDQGWDLVIAHPPCTYLTNSGARWKYEKPGWVEEQKKAVEFFMKFVNSTASMIAIENPIGIMSTRYRKPDQIIQPWQYGHGETKATCLWLKNLPKLISTNIVEGRVNRVHREPPGPDRWKNRSRTYTGIAQAMAEQWGCLDTSNYSIDLEFQAEIEKV